MLTVIIYIKLWTAIFTPNLTLNKIEYFGGP